MMNKAKLFLILPMLTLVSCSAPEVVEPIKEAEEVTVNEVSDSEFNVYYEKGLPHVQRDGSTHVTYLMMSPFGSLNISGAPIKGEVSELFYENTIVWEAEPGTALPTPEQVNTTVEGASFRAWAYYDETNANVFPDYYTTVPTKSGLALKAIFDGTITSGGGDSSGGGTTETGYGLYFSESKKIAGEYTGREGIYEQYKIASCSFTANETFKLYDFENKASWIIDIDPYSFGSPDGDGSKVPQYVVPVDGSWKAVQSFTADVYIKLAMNNDNIYFQLA